ncbi:MAG: phosphonate C-P lyase system protein PhnL [Pseudomonadota bacterium]
MRPMLRVCDLCKDFILHTQGGTTLNVLADLSLTVAAGECVALVGPSGSGKSTLMRAMYANYRPTSGTIEVRHLNTWQRLDGVSPHRVLEVRRETLGYVSQFLRVIPRVSTLDIVMEPALETGVDEATAAERAQHLLVRLNVPEKLWSLPPATFSGGEQQRINVARGFVHPYPVLLLDEPTAALDPLNRSTVIDLIQEAKQRGSAVVGIFHDREVRDQVSTREFSIQPRQAA